MLKQKQSHIRTNEEPEAFSGRSVHKKTKRKNNATRNQHQLLQEKNAMTRQEATDKESCYEKTI